MWIVEIEGMEGMEGMGDMGGMEDIVRLRNLEEELVQASSLPQMDRF
jgi:hypothetical protein